MSYSVKHSLAGFAAIIVCGAGILFAVPANALDAEWRQQAKAYLKQGKADSAMFLVKQASDTVVQQTDMVEKINMLRYIGEISWMAGDTNAAIHQFKEAMRYALSIPEPWKRLSTAISVCELQQKVVADNDLQRILMAPTLESRLLEYAAKDIQASEIGRYIKCFDKAADTAAAAALLAQVHLVAREDVRKKALNALTEIAFDLRNPGYVNLQAKPNAGADTLEKIMWYVTAARLFNTRNSRASFLEYKEMAEKLSQTLPKPEQPRAKKILARIES